VAARFVAAAGPRGLATLVAEGDSWFDYLGSDILNQLERLGYDIESVARRGDTVENMAYGEGQLRRLASVLDRLLRDQRVPRAVLLSGGGNDIAGAEFAQLLNHQASPSPGPNEDIVRGVIDVRARDSYVTIISAVTELCRRQLGRPVPILVHGYDRPRPDGRGFLGGFAFLPGPWLRPGFHAKGYADEELNTATIGALIDRFNAMLQRLVALPGYEHVHYVDLRDALRNTKPDYRKDWANELHPTGTGFRTVADRFARRLASLP
jgi:lysophospholipase L1-like esterase